MPLDKKDPMESSTEMTSMDKTPDRTHDKESNPEVRLSSTKGQLILKCPIGFSNTSKK